MNVLGIENLSVGYVVHKRKKVLVSGMNISVPASVIVSIVGQNGVGKSTILRTLLGLQPPLTGKISLGGQNLSKLSHAERSRYVSAVLSERILLPPLTVGELVTLGRLPHQGIFVNLQKQDRYRIDQAMDLTEIKELEHVRITELSDGQLQKAMIARALAQDAELLLMDEPTSHLDISHKLKIFDLLRRLVHITKKCIILATHEVELSLQNSDYIWWIYQGKLFSGEPEELAYRHRLLEKLSDEQVYFDFSLGNYVFKKPFFREVSFEGEGEWAYWIKHLLIRNAFKICQEASIKMRVLEGQRVEIQNAGYKVIAQNFCELMRYFQPSNDIS